MPRRTRELVSHGTYHVLCHTARRVPVFADRREASAFLDLLRHVALREGWSLLAWCLLPDAYNLALRTSHLPLPRGMKSLQGRFSQEYNRRHGALGPLWHGRYLARLVAEDAHVAPMIVAIHGLPATIGRHTGAAPGTPTGHRDLVGDGEPRPLIDVDAALLAFAPSRAAARVAYEKALRDSALVEPPSPDPRTWPWWQPDSPGRRRLDGPHGAADGPGASVLTAEEFVNAACAAMETTLYRLASRRRDRRTVHLRELVTTTGVELFGFRAKELAVVLCKHPDWVSRWSCRGAERRASDPGYKAEIERVASLVRRAAEPPPSRPVRDRARDWAAWMS